MEDKIINNKFGKVFGVGLRGGAFVFSIIGIFLIIGEAGESALISKVIGIVIVLLSSLPIFLKNGISIDLKNKRIREYYKYFSFHYYKKWETIEDYSFITILSFNMSSSTFSRSNRELKHTEKQHRIHLLNKRHTKRKLIHSFTDEKKAIEFATMIAKELEIETTQYNPPKTQRKGGRR